MNDAEISALKLALKVPGSIVLWQPYDSAPALKVESVGVDRKPETPYYVPEPGEIAFLAQGGGFVNLGNCERRDFIVAQRL